MASFHLDVKAVQRSAGRSATAAAAYRHAERIECEREGRVHDYRAKAGVEHSFIVVGEDAPAWARDRQALWNAVEAREARKDSIVAREWELALPHELDAAGRRELAHGFARELVARYGVAADVAIHAPHREGDQRNWHAHVLTTTRKLDAEGLTAKTRVLDVKTTGGPEIAHMRERWAEMQNRALERVGVAERVDHRSLAAQRAAALAQGDTLTADTLDRAPEVKLGPVVGAVERREERAAEREGRAYQPVTERGAQVHEARAARGLLAELAQARNALRREAQERAALARDAYGHARDEGADPIRAGLAAIRAAAQRQGHGRVASAAEIAERVARLLGRQAPRHAQDGPVAGQPRYREAQQDRQGHERHGRHGRGPEVHGEGSHGPDPIKAQLDALRARERPAAEREAPATGLPAQEPAQGTSWRDRQGHEGSREAHGTGAHEASGADDIKERLDALRARERPARRDGHEEPAHGPDPIDARLKGLMARERPAAHREGPAHERDEDTPQHRQRGHEDDGHGWGL